MVIKIINKIVQIIQDLSSLFISWFIYISSILGYLPFILFLNLNTLIFIPVNQLFVIIQKMLQYRQFLQESRAQRGQRNFQPFSENPSNLNPYQNQNIKQLVSQPNYGQIFYGDQKNRKGASNLKEQLHRERQRNQQMVKYLQNLQQQNAILKAKLAQVLQILQNQNPNVYSHLNILNNPGQTNYPQNYNSKYVTPSIPSQQNINAQPQYYAPNQKNLSLSTQIPMRYVQNNPNINLVQSKTLPNYNQMQNGVGSQHIPNFPNYSRGSIPHNYSANLPEIPEIEQSNGAERKYTSQPLYQPSPNGQGNLQWLVQQKLHEIKDDDQELRQYTIQLLKKRR